MIFSAVSLSIPREWVVATAQRRAAFDKQLKEIVKAQEQKKMTQVEGSIRTEQNTLAHYETAGGTS